MLKPRISVVIYISVPISGEISNIPNIISVIPVNRQRLRWTISCLPRAGESFKWEEVLQSREPVAEYIPEWTGHLINAKITDRNSGEPLENQTVYLAGPGIKSQLAGCISNKKGQLLFDLPHLLGSNVIVLQTENRNDSNYRLDIANPFSEKNSGYAYPVFKLNEEV